MVDTARALLDELMGRNRNLGPSEKVKKINWDDPEFCQYYLVKFCPHDLFVNTRADLGPCNKMHDDEAKKMYEDARPGARKKQYEDDFLRFCNNMLNDVDKKIQKGRQRLLLMSKGEGGPIYVSKFQEQLNNLNARIKKLLNEAEEAGHRGDVDQAQGLMTLCEQLKQEKAILLNQHDSGPPVIPVGITTTAAVTGASAGVGAVTGTGTGETQSTNSDTKSPRANESLQTTLTTWASELNSSQEKQMEVCEVCGAFLIVGDAQQRIEDHLTGKQHIGYSKLRKAVDELYEKRQKEREEEEKIREKERKQREENGHDRSNRRDRERNDRNRDRDFRSRGSDRRGSFRDDRRDRDRFRGRDNRNHDISRHRNRERDRDRERDRNRRDERDSKKRSRTRSRSRK